MAEEEQRRRGRRGRREREDEKWKQCKKRNAGEKDGEEGMEKHEVVDGEGACHIDGAAIEGEESRGEVIDQFCLLEGLRL